MIIGRTPQSLDVWRALTKISSNQIFCVPPQITSNPIIIIHHSIIMQ